LVRQERFELPASWPDADAGRMGTLLAKQMEGLMSEQKWTYAPAVPAESRSGS